MTDRRFEAYEGLKETFQKAREHVPTERQKAESRASFAYGQMALMKEYRDASPEKLAELRALCRRAAGLDD